MQKILQACILSSLFFGSALAEDVSLVVNQEFKEEFHVGGILSFFGTNQDVKETSLLIAPRSGIVVVNSISLNEGHCTFENIVFPAVVTSDKKLQIRPSCNVTKAEIKTDRGTYAFTF